MNICVIFAGTGSETRRKKFEYSEWVTKFTNKNFRATAIDGVGTNENKLKNAYKKLTGKGWANKVQEGLNYVDSTIPEAQREESHNIVSIGHSRGGVEAVVFANCVAKAYPLARQIIIALDPVPGGLTATTTSFEMAPNRNVLGRAWGTITGGRSRDRLRVKYDIPADAWKNVPQEVAVYCSMICQWHSRQRNTSGFTPQMHSRGTITIPKTTQHHEWAIPGDHTDVVAFGVEPKLRDMELKRGASHTKVDHRKLRKLIVEDMIDYALEKADLRYVFNHPLAEVLRNYNIVATADLQGDQAGKQTKYSFINANRAGGTAIVAERWNQGSRQHIGFPLLERNLKGFVNERHHEIWKLGYALHNEVAIDFYEKVLLLHNPTYQRL